MAFTTYTSFVTTVESYLARTDLTTVIPDFIQMAQLRMSRDLRTEAMLKVATTTPTDSKVAFPTDFLELREMHFQGNPPILLEFQTPDLFFRNGQTTLSGRSHYFTMLGTEFQFAPTQDTDYTIQKCFDADFGLLGSSLYSYIGSCGGGVTASSGCSLYLLCGADRAPLAEFYYVTCSGAPVTESVGNTGGGCISQTFGDEPYRCITGSITLANPYGSYTLINLHCGSPSPSPTPTSSYSANIYAKLGANTTNPTTASVYYSIGGGGSGSYTLLGNIWDDTCTNFGNVSVPTGSTIYVGIMTGSVGVNFQASNTGSCSGPGVTLFCGTGSVYSVIMNQSESISVQAKVVANVLATC